MSSIINIADIAKRFSQAIKKYKYILIYIKGSPDPDVIASSLSLKLLCESWGIKAEIFSLTKLSLEQNEAIVKYLKIPITFGNKPLDMDRLPYDAYAVLDFQTAAVNELSSRLPCVVHIDHHEPVQERIKIDFKFATGEIHATSTVLALLLREYGFPFPEEVKTQTATALIYGIQTDTDNYKHAAIHDYDALEYLSPFADRSILNKITDLPYSEVIVTLIAKAIINKDIYKNWLITGVEFIDEAYRDSIAVVADFLLQKESVSTVVVFALVVQNKQKGMFLDASLRTNDEHLLLDPLIKNITENGGARKFKGAYQINLNYFLNCPDRQLLWNVIRTTTVETFKINIDNITMIELKGFYGKMKGRITRFFNKLEKSSPDNTKTIK